MEADMQMFYLIVLRFVHVIAGVCWAGGGFVTFLFLEPTAKDLEAAGMQFFHHMAGKRRFNTFVGTNAALTVLSGTLLLWQDASGQWLAWVQTGPGLGFALGSLVGVVVFFVGMFGVGMPHIKLEQIGKEIEKAGTPPTPGQAAELQKLDKKISYYSRIEFALVALSLALMATARYWLF
jgi:uncharacterized membrane protein